MMSEESSASGTDNCPPMLEESDYGSWKIRIARDKKDKEFTDAENLKELCDIQASNILSQGLPRRIFNTLNQTQSAKEIWESLELLMKGSGQTLDRRKEDLFDEYERFRANDSYIDLYTHLRSYEEHALKKLKKQEQSSSVVDPLAYLVKTTHQQAPTHSTTTSPSQLTPALASTSSSTAQSHDDAMDSCYGARWKNTTESVQRRAPGNTGNTRYRGNQNNGQGVNNKKKVICYNCRGEGHVARQCKEPKRPKDSLWHQDKAMLLQAIENGAVLDAEAEAFLADVECTVLLAEPLALTTTNMFQVNHEDAYDSDVDDEPNAAAAFMANLSSSSSQINEVRTFNDNIFETVSPSWPSEVPQYEHLDFDDDSALVNATLSAELDQCKLELARLERNKVKLECDQVIVARNKRNVKLEQETELLKTTLRNKEATIASLTSETKTVLSEKKTLKDKYLEEIVCLKMLTKLSKRPMIASNDIHKTGLGLSNPWFGKKAQLSQPTLYDGHRLLQPGHAPVTVSDSHETLLETKFVPQKELSKEQVYWLSASDIASQSSDPPKPVTPFVHTRPVNSEEFERIFDELDSEYEQTVLANKNLQIEKKNLLIKNKCLIFDSISKDICFVVLASVNIVPPISDCMCAELRTSCDREHNRVLELEAEISKLHNMLKESGKRCVFIQKDDIDLQLQERDETIRNLESQFNILRMLKIGSPVGSLDKNALETEITQLKDNITSLRIQNDGRFNPHDIFGSRTSTKPILKPSELTPCVSPSTNATLTLEPILEPVELSPSVSSCASLTITMVSRFSDYRLSDRKADSNGISSIFTDEILV
nr:hypothetical protein [Tanacetum cinerariifolium]